MQGCRLSEESFQEKTEEATPHRKAEARKKGDIPRSRELTSMLMLACGWCLLWLGGNSVAGTLAHAMRGGLLFDSAIVADEKREFSQLIDVVLTSLGGVLPLFLGMFVIALVTPGLIGGFSFTPESIRFDLKKLNPISGFKRIFSLKIIPEMLKSILKVVLVGGVVSLYLWHRWESMLRLLYENTFSAMGDALSLIASCTLLVIIGLVPMVGFDILYQFLSYMKKLRMSRQEIRDEYKQQEGDPAIKGRIKQQQRAMARQRMMSDVPKADVIINNPTHYSVALQYQEGVMSAPKVVAKGAGEIALKIRQIGAEHRVPMLEAPPLARALYRHSEVGQQIPAALYSAVAEVLAWVYGLRRWRKEGGVQPRRPSNLPVPHSLDFDQESKH